MEKKISELLSKIYDEAFSCFELYTVVDFNACIKKKLKQEAVSQIALLINLLHEVDEDNEYVKELANTLKKVKKDKK